MRPVRVALVLDRTYATPALRRELRTLGGWLAENHAPGTRVSVIDAASARASAPLRADAAGQRRPHPPAREHRRRGALGARAGDGRDLVVTLGSPAPAPGAAKRLRIATRPGAATGSSAVLGARGERA